MKKMLLIISSIFLVYIMIINQERVVNKTIKNDRYTINYPYFSNSNINSYILNYINKYIENKDYDKLIIDYDYNSNSKILTIYQTTYKGIIENEKSVTFKVRKNSIEKYEKVEKTSFSFVPTNITNAKFIAFTFDDGPNYNTSKIIDVLNKYNVRATFFVMGKNIKGHEDVLVKMKKSNMEVANHTYNHLLLTKYSSEKIKEEIEKTNSLIYDTINEYPTLLRPSYGSVNKRIKKISNMPIIIWNIDTLDWKYKDSNRIYNTIVNNAGDGDIILMHDIYKSTLNSLEKVIPELLNKGYNIVTVSELFYYKNIELEKGRVYGFAKN